MISSHLHPALSTLPFALISISLVAELISHVRGHDRFRELIQWNLIAGVLGVAAAFFSGYLAADFGNQQLGISQDEISRHHLWGKLLLFCGIVTIIGFFVSRRAVYSRATFRILFALLLVSLWILSMITGFLGGDMLLSAKMKSVQIDQHDSSHE